MIYFGCSQWGYANWAGSIYPKKARAGDYLYHYAQKFNAVELNPTYHQDVDVLTLKRWKESVPDNFKFCPKFPKVISHDKQLYGVKELTQQFIGNVSGLKDNLGISFLQLHKDFTPNELPVLNDFLKSLPKDFKISIELRPFWLRYDDIVNRALETLKENGAGVVIVDSLESRQYINKLKLTNHSAFIRFISYGHETDYPRIDDWVKLISVWQSKGLPEIYFFLHFPDENTNLDVLLYTVEQFEKLKPGKEVKEGFFER